MAERHGASLDEIEAAYRTGLSRFVRTAAAIVGDDDRGAEVVQEAFARAVRSRAAFKRGSRLDTWLWRIVVNTARTAKRESAFQLGLGETAAFVGGSDESQELVDVVRALLMQLPEQQRLVLFLRYYADLDYETIAAILELAPGTVGATLTAARARMRGLMQEVAL